MNKKLVLILVVILITGCSVAQDITKKIASKIMTGNTPMPEVHNNKFECENDNSVKSRGYIFLMGLAETNEDRVSFAEQEHLMKQDPKAKFVEFYAQDADLEIEEISRQFLDYMHDLLSKHEVEELVILGSSAGGVTSSYSISRLEFSGPVALHTLASPIRGYDITGFRKRFLGDRTGFIKNIAIGFEPFDAPGDNVKVYHHKTVTDSVLKGYCEDMEDFCEPLKIQNNNIEGSKDFYYPELDHTTIMLEVVKDVLSCYK